MHSKNNNNKTQNFLQGLRPFASSIPRSLKKLLKKGGYNYSNIIDNWTNMVGKEISNSCYPSTIKMGKNMNDGILILNVIHGMELDIEYKKKNIIDKINSFFGYNCISQIKLKIVSEQKLPKKKIIKPVMLKEKFKKKLENVQNNELRNSLNNLIKAFNEKNN